MRKCDPVSVNDIKFSTSSPSPLAPRINRLLATIDHVPHWQQLPNTVEMSLACGTQGDANDVRFLLYKLVKIPVVLTIHEAHPGRGCVLLMRLEAVPSCQRESANSILFRMTLSSLIAFIDDTPLAQKTRYFESLV